jgi:hypothetical protein
MSRDPPNAFHTRKHTAKVACKVAMQGRGLDALWHQSSGEKQPVHCKCVVSLAPYSHTAPHLTHLDTIACLPRFPLRCRVPQIIYRLDALSDAFPKGFKRPFWNATSTAAAAKPNANMDSAAANAAEEMTATLKTLDPASAAVY